MWSRFRCADELDDEGVRLNGIRTCSPLLTMIRRCGSG